MCFDFGLHSVVQWPNGLRNEQMKYVSNGPMATMEQETLVFAWATGWEIAKWHQNRPRLSQWSHKRCYLLPKLAQKSPTRTKKYTSGENSSRIVTIYLRNHLQKRRKKEPIGDKRGSESLLFTCEIQLPKKWIFVKNGPKSITFSLLISTQNCQNEPFCAWQGAENVTYSFPDDHGSVWFFWTTRGSRIKVI